MKSAIPHCACCPLAPPPITSFETTARRGRHDGKAWPGSHRRDPHSRPSQRAVSADRPPRDAPPSDWLTYHRRNAAVYAEIAEIDRGHHHEAIYWANRERARADEVQHELDRSTGQR
ncbi:AMED_5909 family protein [Actinokineospora sp. HUAS TT18]|uniref:AMED_5909 family protein n=1 Tax=Actinokineospora sp. HUAS TT18 TaxID=3447451 RepID=UPI003F522E45